MKNDPFGSAANRPAYTEDTSEVVEEATAEPTVQLNVEVPQSIRDRLKIYCIKEKREMREVVAELLDAHLPE